MKSPKKIAFIQPGPMPLGNQQTAEHLAAQFPGWQMDVFDFTAWFKKNRPLYLLARLAALVEFFFDIVTGNGSPKIYFWGSSFVLWRIKRFVARQITAADYAFSLQMQSLFDASSGAIPHYVYTDHTLLENLTYTYPTFRSISPRLAAREKLIYQNAVLVFTRSHNISRSVVNDYGCPPDKVVCVYAGSNAAFDETLALDNDNYHNKNILFVGIDWERKGGPELMAAFADLLPQHPDARLTIVGCTPAVNSPNVQIVGRVPVEEVGRYFRQAAIFCLPTKQEPFGIVFIEAMAHKLPIVGTTVGAVPDFLEDGRNGYLVPPGDSQALAAALTRLLDDPDQCRRFGENGRQRALQDYNWSQVAARIAARIKPALDPSF